MTLLEHFTLNAVFCQFKFKICLFTYMDGTFTYMQTQTAQIYDCWKFVACFSGLRLTASMSSANKQLNKILTAYD